MKAFVLMGLLVATTFSATANMAVSKTNAKSVESVQDQPVLKLSIVTSKLRYRTNDQFKLSVMLNNVSDNEFYVFGRLAWGYSGTLMFFVYDAAGNEIEPKLIPDEPPFAPRNDNSDYVKLRPDHFLGTTYFAPVKLMNLTPGRYSVVVKYQCPFSRGAVKVAPIWGKENGILRSNIVHIEVLR